MEEPTGLVLEAMRRNALVERVRDNLWWFGSMALMYGLGLSHSEPLGWWIMGSGFGCVTISVLARMVGIGIVCPTCYARERGEETSHPAC